MKTVLMRTPNALDGVSLYRHWGPMIELEKQGHVKLLAMDNDSQITHWHYYQKADLAFIHRPAKIYDHAFITECLKYDLPIWIDVDDNLFCIPDDNDAFDYFNKQAQEILLYGLESASRVTVATKPLQEFLRSTFQIDSVVVPNAISDSLLKYKREFSGNDKIIWRGSKAGERALRHYSDSIEEIQIKEENKNKEWNFWGLSPYWLDRKNFKKPLNYIDYIIQLSKLNASHCFITHLNTEFDSTKSHNGWIEATLAGGICLVPKHGEWNELPDEIAFYYKPSDLFDFKSSMELMFSCDFDYLKQIHLNSINYIEKNLVLSIINKQRLGIINEITQNQTPW